LSASASIGAPWDSEELEDLLLKGRELRFEGAYESSRGQEIVSFEASVEAQDLLGGGPLRGALLGVEGQRIDTVLLHGGAQLAFDERLDEERQEVDEEEGLDAAGVLEQDRSDLEDGLGLLEAFLDRGLALVASSTCRGERPRSLVSSGYMPSLLRS